LKKPEAQQLIAHIFTQLIQAPLISKKNFGNIIEHKLNDVDFILKKQKTFIQKYISNFSGFLAIRLYFY
jgi:hypothetical protein